MNRFAWLILAVAVVSAGCHKKEQTSMEDLNAVSSENVVSVVNMDNAQNAVPVIVENADALNTQGATEMVAVADAVVEKPTSKQIQQALKNAGFYNGKVDGDIGPKTKKAVEAFQAQNGLKADGKVGPRTWKALSAHLNGSAEVVNPTAVEQNVSQQ